MPGRLVRVVVALTVLLAAGAAWYLWRQKRDRSILFNRFPGENVLLLYVDVERVRHTAALAPVLRARVDPDPDYAAFVKQTGFDYQRDLDAAAVCYLPDRVYVVARGRFDAARLRQYALEQGGGCSGAALERPCQMPASRLGRRLSFVLLASGVLALATAREADAVLQLETMPALNAGPLARAAAASDPTALLWATAAPAALDQALSKAAEVSPNLSLFSRTLAGAQRAYLFINDQSPNLELALRAVCTSEDQAAEMRRLLQGLNDFIRGLLRGPPSGRAPSLWEKVLATAVIQQDRNTVRASWTFDQEVLRGLAGSERKP